MLIIKWYSTFDSYFFTNSKDNGKTIEAKVLVIIENQFFYIFIDLT